MLRPIHGGNLDWAAKQAGCPTDEIIDFSASINPLGPPQSAIEAINQGLGNLKHYPNPDYTQLREAIAQYHHLNGDLILPANGAAELLTWFAWEAHDLQGVLLPSPCFADYKRALTTFNVPWVSYSLDALTTGLTVKNSHQWGLLINNPHNPTGKLWSQKTLMPYLDNFALVIIDEAFMDFFPDNDQESLLKMVRDYDNLLVIRSLTKFYSLPGLRIGYGISSPDRIKKWRSWRDPWSVNTLAIIAGCACLEDKSFGQKTWQWLPLARKKLHSQLSQISQLQVFPSQANFLLVKSQIPSPKLQLQLLQENCLLIRDCVSFPELGDKYFRVAVKMQPENQKLSNAITLIYSQEEQ